MHVCGFARACEDVFVGVGVGVEVWRCAGVGVGVGVCVWVRGCGCGCDFFLCVCVCLYVLVSASVSQALPESHVERFRELLGLCGFERSQRSQQSLDARVWIG